MENKYEDAIRFGVRLQAVYVVTSCHLADRLGVPAEFVLKQIREHFEALLNDSQGAEAQDKMEVVEPSRMDAAATAYAAADADANANDFSRRKRR